MGASKNYSGNGKGLSYRAHLFPKGSPLESIEYEKRTASITDDRGGVIFQQDNVEVPKSWSQLATNVVASKYFYGAKGTSEREYSVKQLIHRVTRTIADWGLEDGYFATKQDAENFYNELSGICINQYASFNSPAWFNVGLHHIYGHSSSPSAHSFSFNNKKNKIVQVIDNYKNPQSSACFIQHVNDTMEDIMRLATSEAMLFKYGSGTGTDLSTLRSSKERLSGGGTPSGPLSFMRIFDQVAAVIKSGGKTRRAAKMQSLKVSHPDIVDFIQAKSIEEKKAWALIDAGYDGSFGGDAYNSVMFQNGNLSVRVSDEFMEAVKRNGDWKTKAVTTGRDVETLKAKSLMRMIAEGTHICGDPGLQYDTTINKANTCINSGRINASNPCSEYMFLDNSACNLSSINLLKFLRPNGEFDIAAYERVASTMLLAQEILVDRGSYPGFEIAENSHLYRPLGLGYANLGAILMEKGLPYDSEEGRAYAAAITGLLTSTAYKYDSKIAGAKGAFERFKDNKEPMMAVIENHKNSMQKIDKGKLKGADAKILKRTAENFEYAQSKGNKVGFRNAQVTLLAPTGTIGFMMDCDTTGVEPDIALVKYKQLAGGGVIKLVNQTVRPALRRLRYDEKSIEEIIKHMDETETIEGAPGLKPEHLPIFDCAFKPKNGVRFISYQAHINMMAAVQPFLSGAISKTVNMPNDSTVEDIERAYIEGWEKGLKALAIYRDGSKKTQPIGLQKGGKSVESAYTLYIREKGKMLRALDLEADSKIIEETAILSGSLLPVPTRRKMPQHRQSLTSKLELAGHEIYATIGLYDHGSPGELFLTSAKEGSFTSGILDQWATSISIGLQYGIPLREYVKKMEGASFEPSGFATVGNPGLLAGYLPPITGSVKSVADLLGRHLINVANVASRLMLPAHVEEKKEDAKPSEQAAIQTPETEAPQKITEIQKKQASPTESAPGNGDCPPCPKCGHITVPNGRCHRCPHCGESLGCS